VLARDGPKLVAKVSAHYIMTYVRQCLSSVCLGRRGCGGVACVPLGESPFLTRPVVTHVAVEIQ